MIKIIKPVKISFLIILILTLIISCPNKLPIENNNKIEETRDENGHLEQINYYDNDTLYKTEFYEYLNKHDEESRLIKTVENGQTTYEMEECWKIAYTLQNNVYKFDGVFSRIYPNRREFFGQIDFNEKTIPYCRNTNENETYYILDCTASCGRRTDFYSKLKLIYLSENRYEITWLDPEKESDGNRHIFILAEE